MTRIVGGIGLFTVLSAIGCGPGPGYDSSGKPVRNMTQEQRREQFDLLRKRGKEALEAKRYDEAVKDLDSAVQLQDDPETRQLLRQAKDGREQARKAAYDSAMAAGDKALQEKRYAAAVAAFKEALANAADDAKASGLLKEAEFYDFRDQGKTALQANRYGDAVRALTEAANRRPQDEDCQNLLRQARKERRREVMAQGRAAMDAGRYEEAVQAFSEAKALMPDQEVTDRLAEAEFQAKKQRGRDLVARSSFAAAIPILEEVSRLRPADQESKDLLEKAKDGKKKQDKADYDRAMANGDAAMSARNYASAIQAYNEALSKLPNDPTAQGKRSAAENAKRKMEQEEAAKRKADKERADKEKADKAARDKAVRDKAAKDKADKERADAAKKPAPPTTKPNKR
jgi:tetratricopeptide (TPR) repeat protein